MKIRLALKKNFAMIPKKFSVRLGQLFWQPDRLWIENIFRRL